MIFEFGKFKVDIDVDRTREFYKRMVNVSDGCNCIDCRNYEKAMEYLPGSVTDFFNTIGIDIKKVSEVYTNITNPDGAVFYGGFYHLCGKLLSGDSAWVEENTVGEHTSRVSHWEQANTYALTRDFYVSFQSECALVEEEFPTPVLQLEIAANIPWVLEEENTCPKDDKFYLYGEYEE